MDFPYIDPVIVHIWGPIALRWYALAYLLGLFAAIWLGNYRAKHSSGLWTQEQVSDFMFVGFLGVILGGRIGYVLFYQFSGFLDNPFYLFKVWEGGMSFHGGLIGVLVAIAYYSRKTKKAFFTIGDFLVPLLPIGLGMGRLGNFINGELYGRAVVDQTLPWAMRFKCNEELAPWYTACDPEGLLRHPSQLYQFALEGVALFIVLYWFSSKSRPRAAVSAVFLIGYGIFRFFVEFFREPDAHLKEMAEFLTMGQVLSIPMVIAGGYLFYLAYKKPVFDVAEPKEDNVKQDHTINTKKNKSITKKKTNKKRKR